MDVLPRLCSGGLAKLHYTEKKQKDSTSFPAQTMPLFLWPPPPPQKKKKNQEMSYLKIMPICFICETIVTKVLFIVYIMDVSLFPRLLTSGKTCDLLGMKQAIIF